MSYVKPELSLLGNSIRAIQSGVNKGISNSDNPNNCPSQFATASAYEADE
jgi:hypothetical protein